MTEEGRSLRAQVLITQPAARVFELLTNSSDLEMWFCEHAEVELNRGVYNFWGIYTPDTPFREDRRSRLLDVQADQSISFEWELRGSLSRVDYNLESRDDGTLLTVTHTNLTQRATEEAAMHDFWYSVLENLRLLAATGRMQQMCDYRRKVGPTIEVQIDIAGSAADVFDRIVNPEQIDRYFGENSVVEPEPGGRFDYGWKSGGPIRIVEIAAPHRLVYTWKYDEPMETIVTWQLVDSAGRTRLTIVHSGFADDFESEGYRSGWFSFLSIIKGMVELGSRWNMIEIAGIEHGDA